jgi:hypothetical protein
MNSNWLRFGVAAVVLTGCTTGQAPSSTETPIPTAMETPIPLAVGSFTAPFSEGGTTIEIQASGSGESVSGEMDVSEGDGQFSVDLQCTRTTDSGVILIGGDATTSTHDAVPQGSRVAIPIQPGTPPSAGFWFEEPPPAASCSEFLEGVPDDVVEFLQPIEGDLELAP